MNRICLLPFTVALPSPSALAPVSPYADTLLVERVKQERGAHLPTRGMTHGAGRTRFGAPASKLTPAGGDAPQHPVINRWIYANFTVYFERDRVIDSVVNRASANEIGPKGAVSDQ